MKFTVTGSAGIKLRQNLAGLKTRFDAAITAAANMAASMILIIGRLDIASAGNFETRWTDGLHVTVDGDGGSLGNIRISMTHDIPYAGIFETGGTIYGNPLLWIPFSDTDAAGIGARDYPGLVSARGDRPLPLLLSISDKLPRYFGVESVTIPQKFHLNSDIQSVMANFRAIFDINFRAGA